MNGLLAWFGRSRLRVAVAKLLFAAVLVGLVAFEGVALARQPTVPHVLVVVSGVCVCLCAVPWSRVPLLARAWPAAGVSWAVTLTLFAGDHPLKVWGLAEAIALLILLSAVLQRAPTRSAAVLGPLLGLAAMASPVRDEDPGRYTTLFAVVTVVVAAYSLLLRAQSAQRTRDLQAVRTAERIELARELHDLVAHHVTGIVVQAGAARFTAVSGDQAAETFGRIEKAGEEALRAMRRLVKVLREGAAETQPVAGLAQVSELTGHFSEQGPPAILYVEPGLVEELPGDLAALAYRVVRECLTNIRKHAADASAVRVGIRTVRDGLEIRVADDATQPTAHHASGGGFGLAGLTERVAAMDGTLTAGPSPEGGWEVRAVVPYDGR